MMNRAATIAALAACAWLALAASVLAHDVEKGPHGGPMIDVKGTHIELVVTGGDIKVYVTDAKHEPIASKGASGRAVVLVGGKQSVVELKPAEPNLLTGKSEAALGAGARVVVSTKLATGNEVQARFQLK